MKDSQGKTLLEFIMAKLKAQDENFDEKLKELIQKTVFKDVDNEYIKGKTRELQAMVGNAKAAFEQVKTVSANDRYVSQSMDLDDFQTIMGDFLTVTDKELAIIVEDSAKVFTTHTQICDFYGVDAKDEMRDKSENFFKLFQEFFKLCAKSMPPPEKKKPIKK